MTRHDLRQIWIVSNLFFPPHFPHVRFSRKDPASNSIPRCLRFTKNVHDSFSQNNYTKASDVCHFHEKFFLYHVTVEKLMIAKRFVSACYIFLHNDAWAISDKKLTWKVHATSTLRRMKQVVQQTMDKLVKLAVHLNLLRFFFRWQCCRFLKTAGHKESTTSQRCYRFPILMTLLSLSSSFFLWSHMMMMHRTKKKVFLLIPI